MPVGVHEQQAADHRRDRRRDAEIDRHLRHHALRLGRREHVADDGARNHHAGAGRHALQRAKEHQRADGLRQRAADRRQREQRQPASTTGRRPKLSDSAPWNRFITAKPNR